MGTLSVEQIITVSVMSLWLLFPLGMFISVMRQQNDEIRPNHPKNIPIKKENVIHVTPISSYTYDHDEDEEEFNGEDYEYTKIPKKDTDTHHRHT